MEDTCAGSKNVRITVHKDLLEASKGLLALGVIFSRVKVSKFDQNLWNLLQKAGEKQQKEHKADQIEHVEEIKALRDTYKNLGLRLSDYKGSNEALLKRVLSSKGLYQINTVVDTNNYVSIESLRSVGSYDLSQLAGDITFRKGLPNEKYTGTTNRSLFLKNLPVLCDENGPFGSPTSDSNRALINETTTDVLTVIYSFDGPSFLEEQLLKVKDLLKTYAAGETFSMFIVKDKLKLDQSHLVQKEEQKEILKYETQDVFGQAEALNSAAFVSVDDRKFVPNKKEEKTKDVHQLGIEYTKEGNFSKWYQQVITKSELIEYYEISGCYILRPLAYFIWEQIQGFLDPRFKKNGVSNCYFPMFVTNAALSKEKAHVEGFAPEVAWVTKSGTTDLPEPIAIRPTSETIMYPSYAKWIHSHRDLPLLLNQWTNVVRWEFKHPTPFIRTREFLWQEGHTAHSTTKEADIMVLKMLDNYADCYKNLLAVPCVKGQKSEEEKFAGANYTTTVELFIPTNGRGIQGATSHHLGQNFAKMFDVWFEDKNGQKQFVWQTSWGFSTRSIGAMILVHSDNKGLVLPPRVAQFQLVLVPITYKEDTERKILTKITELAKHLKDFGVRVYLDDNDNYNPGWKFNHWEIRGTPLRIELGKNDYEKEEVRVVRRDNGAKIQMKWTDLATNIAELLDRIHNDMFERALQARDEHLKDAYTWNEFMIALNSKNLILTPWCRENECEIKVKGRSKEESLKVLQDAGEEEEVLAGAAKTLCLPFDPKSPLKQGDICFHCGKEAKIKALWGRSY